MMSDTAVFNPISGVPTSGSVVIHDGYADSLPAYANVLETNFIKLFIYNIFQLSNEHTPSPPAGQRAGAGSRQCRTTVLGISGGGALQSVIAQCITFPQIHDKVKTIFLF
jgi:hypothetical protein